jgi:hypothetical protein
MFGTECSFEVLLLLLLLLFAWQWHKVVYGVC